MRKTLSIVLSLLMVLSIFSPVFAEEEVTAETIEKNEEYIEFLKEINIIKGDKSGDLMLDKDIDRASFAAILVRADGKEAVAESVKTLPSKFADMTAAHWGNGYATVAHDNLWMKGNPAGEFMPGKEISYAEIATTLVRFLGEEKDGMVYPTSYIAKATELGLFKGTEEIAGEYTKNAVRKNVFMMLYNALSREDFGKYNVYKLIVLENGRVAKLADNQIKAEVLSVVQMANNVNERGVAKVGEQMVFNIADLKKVEGGLADTENLLGKVANFTVDQDGKIVKAVIDNSYEYLAGGITTLSDKYFGVNYSKYSVRVDERYYDRGLAAGRYDRDDRMYRTYLTTDRGTVNFNYEKFAAEKAAKNIDPNFARMTVKDGMVLFVDAYALRDIAPVQKVERDGSDVYYWNDMRNAAVERMTPANTVIGYTAKDGFRRITKADIKADDVIHWMDGFTLVRQDAKLDANLVKTYVDDRAEWAVLKIAEDKTIDRNLSTIASGTPEFLRSVYAYDDAHYRTTVNRGDVNGMRGSDVKVLLDVNNKIQLITSHEKFTDRLALVDRVISAKGMQFYLPNAQEKPLFRLTDSWDSDYYRNGFWNGTQTRRFDEFNRLDLVYTAADKDENVETVAVIDGFDYVYENQGQFSAHPWLKAKFVDARRDFIRVGGQDYRYTDETDVFVINKDRDGIRRNVVSNVTLADVIKYDKDNADLRAAVLTEKTYAEFLDKIDVDSYGRFNDARADFAKAIIFTNYSGPQADLERPEIGKIVRIDNYANVVEIEVARGQYEEFKIAPESISFKQTGLINQYVEFRRVKGSDPKAARFDMIITATDAGKVDRRTAYTITVNGHTYNTDKNTKEFGDSRSDYAWVYVNGGYADLIVFTNDPTPAVAKDTGIVTRADSAIVVVDGKEIYFTTDRTVLRNAKGEIVKIGKIYEADNLVDSQVVIEKNDKNEAIEIRIVNTKADLSLEKAKARFAQTSAFKDEAMEVKNDEDLNKAKQAVARITAPEADANVLDETTTPKKSEYDAAENNLTATKENIAAYEKAEQAKIDVEAEADKINAVKVPATTDLTTNIAALVKTEVEKLVDTSKVDISLNGRKSATADEIVYNVIVKSTLDPTVTTTTTVSVTKEAAK